MIQICEPHTPQGLNIDRDKSALGEWIVSVYGIGKGRKHTDQRHLTSKEGRRSTDMGRHCVRLGSMQGDG
jgi:hypothetical protein